MSPSLPSAPTAQSLQVKTHVWPGLARHSLSSVEGSQDSALTINSTRRSHKGRVEIHEGGGDRHHAGVNPLVDTPIPIRPCGVLCAAKAQKLRPLRKGSGTLATLHYRIHSLVENVFRHKFPTTLTCLPCALAAAAAAGVRGSINGEWLQGFVIKPRPDGRRHLRTWTSGRGLVRGLPF